MLSINVATAAATRGLRRLHDNLSRRSADALKDAGSVVLNAAKQNILHGRSDWPPVKRPDLRRSIVSRSQTTPLLDTGRLMRDIHMEAEPEVVVVGNSLAITHRPTNSARSSTSPRKCAASSTPKACT